MVDFGNTLFDAKLGSEVPLVNPVRDQSGEMFAQGLKSGLDGAASWLQADAQNKKAAKASPLYGDITEKVGLLADARDQGTLTLAQANRQLRVWSNEWVSEMPAYADDIFTFINKLTQDNGIGGSIYKESPEEAGNRKKIEEAVSKGWDVSTPEGLVAYDKFQSNAIQLEMMAQELTAIQTKNGILTEGNKAQFVSQFQAVASSAFPWVQNKVEKAYNALQGVSDPASRQTIIDQLKSEVAAQTGLLSSLGANAGATQLDYLITPINRLIEQFELTASGKSTQQAYETSVARTKAQMEALMFTDPKNGKLFITNAVSPFTDPYAIAKLDAAKLGFAAGLNVSVTRSEDGSVKMDEKPTDVVDTAENMAPVLDLERSTVTNMLAAESLTPEETQAMNDKIAVILHSTARNGAAETDATQFNTVVNYLADTSVGQWIEQNYQAIGSQIASDAATVVGRQYSDVVLDLVSERWLEAQTDVFKALPDVDPSAVGMGGASSLDTEKLDISKVIEPVWNGYGVEFRVKDAYKKYAALAGIAKDLNQGPTSVAGPINRLVRMGAHLQGSTDYEKYYTELTTQSDSKGRRLWATGEEGPNVSDTVNPKSVSDIQKAPQFVDRPSDLSLDDFDMSDIEQALENSKAANPRAMLMASNATELAQAYIGQNENDSEEAATISAFIKRNAGIDINPASTAWCAAFLDAVLHASGSAGTGKLNARSYLQWGIPVNSPQVGDVVVLERGGKGSWEGHVGLFMGFDEAGGVRVLGGNTGDAVGEKAFPADKVLGFRRAG